MSTTNQHSAGLLSGYRVLETGPRLAGAVSTRLFAELGADVIKIEPVEGDPVRKRGPFPEVGARPDLPGVFSSQNTGKRGFALDLNEVTGRARFNGLAQEAHCIVCTWHPKDIRAFGLKPEALWALNSSAVLVYITPFGISGPSSDYAGSDLIAFHASGLARALIGPVDDLEASSPVRAAGEQSEFISGITAACAAMHGLYRRERSGVGALIDVSMQEALAYMDVSGLAAPAFGKAPKGRLKEKISGPSLTILPAADGFVAISPREEHQWQLWLELMGNPGWGGDPRFATRALRDQNAEEVIGLISEWSRQRNKEDIFRKAQAKHIPCFPFMAPAEHLGSAQLTERGYFRELALDSHHRYLLPGTPYGLPSIDTVPSTPYVFVGKKGAVPTWRSRSIPATGAGIVAQMERTLPLKGVRVIDFSWVMAGPICTRYLAAMGAEVVKIETSARPDPGRAGQFHDVIGQAKLGITLNLKTAEGTEAIKKLITKSDIVIENFAPGVMDRLGLGWTNLVKLQPNIVMVSASGTGQKGPDAHVVAYGTLLQAYTGFAAMNGYPGRPPAIGMAWADPLCGLLLAFSTVAALRCARSTETGRHVDFSMIEGILSTMPGALLEYQMNKRNIGPCGNDDPEFFPHGVFRCEGDDAWIAISVTNQGEWKALADVVEAPQGSGAWDVAVRRSRRGEINRLIDSWTKRRDSLVAMQELQALGIQASASMSSVSLFEDAHLRKRGFFRPQLDRKGLERLMPHLPWQWVEDVLPQVGAAPELGEDTVKVLQEILGYSSDEVATLQVAGALT